VPMSSIAVVGDERNILGFRPFGVDVHFYVRNSGDLEEWFRDIVRQGYTLIIVTESIAEILKSQIEALWEKQLPVVLTIRGLAESKGFASDRLRRLVIKAIGTDLFKEE
jgi:V/A-type H+-transporting ATPase subunit F